MNHRLLLTLTLLVLAATAQASSLCSEKEQDIQREIGYAEKHHNRHRVEGLKKALVEVRKNCSNSEIRAARQRKTSGQKTLIEARQADLNQACQKRNLEETCTSER